MRMNEANSESFKVCEAVPVMESIKEMQIQIHFTRTRANGRPPVAQY